MRTRAELRERLGRLWAWFRSEKTQRAIGLLMAAEGTKWVLNDFAKRIAELEGAADARRLDHELGHLEGLATTGDLRRLEERLHARYDHLAPTDPHGGDSAAAWADHPSVADPEA